MTEFKSKCACGEQIKFLLKKPKAFTNSIGKATCSGCLSKYLFTISKDHKNPNTPFKITPKVIELSDQATDIIEVKLFKKRNFKHEKNEIKNYGS